jgi:hypothetical protein
MKFYKFILIILVIFFKTGNVLSISNIFDVDNIEIEKKGKVSNDVIATQAIKKGFQELIHKILLKEDIKKLQALKISEIKELVSYYQISNKKDENNNFEKNNFNISFDKEKIHDLFYKKGISYSIIKNKEIFILPILKKNNQIFIYNQNFFYENWNETNDADLVEFILPLENIEIIQNINSNINNLANLDVKNLFSEYTEKNIALILIEDENLKKVRVYLKIKISGKNIIKNIYINRSNLSKEKFYKKIIFTIRQEIINLLKLQNLIDIRAPSFLNTKLDINKDNNLVELRSRILKINSIENIYIQKFNNKFILLKIKYLGNIDKVLQELENQKIILKLIGDQWNIKIIK